MIGVIKAEKASSFPGIDKIYREVDANSIQPGKESGIFFKTFEGFVSFEEGILGEIVGILMVANHLEDCGINTRLVCSDEFGECLMITRYSLVDQGIFLFSAE